MSNLEWKFKEEIGNWLNAEPDRISLYWKGRVALYSLLKAADIQPGDEVIMPAFTCVVVPNAVIYAGGKPVYVDIEPDTLNAGWDKIKSAVTERTRIILCQNTFGLSSDIDLLAEFGRKNEILTIEDCTHGFGGTFKGKPNGTWCDAAFYSTQWNKPFSTGLGGFSFISNDELLEKVKKMDKELLSPTWKQKFLLGMLIKVRKKFLTPATYWMAVRTYRKLSKMGLVTGSSSGEELEGVKQPEKYFKGMSDVQIREGIKSLQSMSEALRKRKTTGALYTKTLKELGSWFVAERYFEDHSFLQYPVLVKNREKFKALAEKANVELGDWFCSPLHPVEGDLSVWNMKREEYPVADEVSRKILNLPTDTKNPDQVVEFLHRNKSLLSPGIKNG